MSNSITHGMALGLSSFGALVPVPEQERVFVPLVLSELTEKGDVGSKTIYRYFSISDNSSEAANLLTAEVFTL